MEVLILTRTFPPDAGAVGHLVKELALALEQRGERIGVIAGGSLQDAASAETLPFPVRRVGAMAFTRKSHFRRALSYLSLYPAMLWAALGQRRPDVIITTTDPPLQAVLGVVLKLRFRCQLVHWCQDLYPEMAEEAGVIRKQGILANFLRWVSTVSLQRHDAIVSIGRCMTRRLVERGIEAKRIVQISNWTNCDVIVPIERSESRLVQREGLQGKFLAVYSGNIGIAHTFHEILDAAEMLQLSTPDVLFLFIGDGPRRKEVETKVLNRGLGNVRFVPAQPWKDLSDSMGSAHLHLVTLRPSMIGLVVPSKFYGIMAAGRPCLLVGPRESEVGLVIERERVGAVVSSGREMAEAIAAYRDQAERRADEGKKARLFSEEAGCERAASQFQRLLREIAGSR